MMKKGENPSIYGRIDRVDTPSNWYDYSAKRYANIVTVNDNEVAYLGMDTKICVYSRWRKTRSRCKICNS